MIVPKISNTYTTIAMKSKYKGFKFQIIIVIIIIIINFIK